jgi:hypothetical protein
MITDGREWVDENLKGDPANVVLPTKRQTGTVATAVLTTNISAGKFVLDIAPNGLAAQY